MCPAERSEGGFRLYSEAEVRRLGLARRMRLLGFCLEDMRALPDVLERLPDGGGPLPEGDERAREELVARLRTYWVEADGRCEESRGELARAEEFAWSLQRQLARLVDAAPAVVEGAVR